ncbi:hypothetical protein BJF79_03600 [Actinomadura sp. CNU-125]|uniref:hypothetical protein n=1 Tax=Actinomadura sp. CNU-125 TaxID=1904961 RepID=UPI0009689189|nr:hypothetical protein [Actinomadura sp. CNU-125]OLT12997.1 hypothetical protein BJF79_03600 [Actinomadura sp. CNU-125]
MALDDAYPTGATQLETTAQWEAFVSSFATDGVVAGVRGEFAPYLNFGARTAAMVTGAALIRGFRTEGASDTAVAIPAPSAQDRVDRLVLRLDRDSATAAGWVTAAVLTGTPGTSPQPPALTQTTDGIYEIPISRWTSAANGQLSGFADERVIAAAPPVEFNSWARPSPSLRRVGFDRTTGSVLWADGTSWRVLSEDTGWINLQLSGATAGPNANSWTNNVVSRVRLRDRQVHLRLAIRRWDDYGLGLDDANGSVPFILPSLYRPEVWEVGFGYHSRSPVVVRVEPDGSVRIFPLETNLPAGRTIIAGANYFI